MEQTVIEDPQASEPFNRFSIPVRWGIIWGILSCILTTIEFMFLTDSYIIFMASWIVMFIVGLIFYCVAGIQQRKAMGGYITFKEAFQTIFVVILISSIISSIYGFIYFNYIDPDAMDKVKETVIGFMEKVNAPQESIDKGMEDFDERAGDLKSVSKMFYAFCKNLIVTSIFGFICAAIVKKKKPEFGAA